MRSWLIPDIVSAALGRHGLTLRGGFDFADDDVRPTGPSGGPARSVLLIGTVGAGWWPHFRRWRAGQAAELADPLDTWTHQVVEPIAQEVGGRLAMPNDRPYAPFQQWAMRAEGIKPSPLGILMHPRYGLWHAYRAALLFDEPLPQDTAPPTLVQFHPCDGCIDKPCLLACPVGAHSTTGFAYGRCLDHVRGPDGGRCHAGCLDRNACPAGGEHGYPAEAQTFLQRAFARL